jgi:hypothetical protein
MTGGCSHDIKLNIFTTVFVDIPKQEHKQKRSLILDDLYVFAAVNFDSEQLGAYSIHYSIEAIEIH